MMKTEMCLLKQSLGPLDLFRHDLCSNLNYVMELIFH